METWQPRSVYDKLINKSTDFIVTLICKYYGENNAIFISTKGGKLSKV